MRTVELKMKDKEKTDPFGNPTTASVIVLWRGKRKNENRILMFHPSQKLLKTSFY